jgi:uncharacterized membrane protein YjgN (DUF898 family)
MAVVRSAVSDMPPPARVEWTGDEAEFRRLGVETFIRSWLTFGVHYFWGRIAIRRKIWDSIRLDGVPLAYSGTGKEGLITFLIAMSLAAPVFVIGAALVAQYLTMPADAGIPRSLSWRAQRLMLSLPLLFLFGSITYRRRTHILKRTWLGDHRFGQAGGAWNYAAVHFWTAFLVAPTLGWLAPWRQTRLYRRMTNETTFGGRRFRAIGDRTDLRAFAKLWSTGIAIYIGAVAIAGLLCGDQIVAAASQSSLAPLRNATTLVTLAAILVGAWLVFMIPAKRYRARTLNAHVSSFQFGATRLTLAMPPAAYARLWFQNLILRIGTLGALSALADARMARFVITHLSVDGPTLPQSLATMGGPVVATPAHASATVADHVPATA